MKKKYESRIFLFPKLPSVAELGILRFRGSGLSNCLFVATRAHLIAKNNNWKLINPTWLNFSLGPYLRKEKDKRHYSGLFTKTGISGLYKIFLLVFGKRITVEKAISGQSGIIEISGLNNYYEDIISEQNEVKRFIYSIIKKKHTEIIDNTEFNDIIGIHIRLGDYNSSLRTDKNWYINIIKLIYQTEFGKYKFYIFSDGLDEELSEILKLPNVERVFFGNALSDILALSKCKLIVGSDSTFSAWAAFLEQTPIIFPKRHFGKVLKNENYEFVENGDNTMLSTFLRTVLSTSQKNQN